MPGKGRRSDFPDNIGVTAGGTALDLHQLALRLHLNPIRHSQVAYSFGNIIPESSGNYNASPGLKAANPFQGFIGIWLIKLSLRGARSLRSV